MRLGGAERHVLHLAAGLRQRGYHAGIACLFREGKLASEVRKEQIPFVCLGIREGWRATTPHQIFLWLRSIPIDILHTYLFGFHFFAGLPARLSGVPVVLSSRREVPLWQRLRHRWVENLGNLFVDGVTCCSEAVRTWTLQKESIQPKKVFTIYNGVDIERFTQASRASMIREELGIPKDAVLIGTVANFAFEKGYPCLLEAAERILRSDPNVWFLFVGSGPLEKEIKEQVQRLSGSERMVITGSRSDIPDLIGAMDIFVLSSVIEGFPNVLLEALAMSRPVVATRVGGVPELIDSGEDGILVPPKDGEALAEAIGFLLRNPQKARALGIRGAEKVRRSFTLERMIDQYESFYLSLFRSKPPSLAEKKEKTDFFVHSVSKR